MTWRAKSGCIIKTMIWIMDSTRRFAKSNERVGIRKIVFLMQGRHLQLSHQTGSGRCSRKILVLVLWVQNSSRGFSYWLAVEQCNLYLITNLPVMGFSTFNGFFDMLTYEWEKVWHKIPVNVGTHCLKLLLSKVQHPITFSNNCWRQSVDNQLLAARAKPENLRSKFRVQETRANNVVTSFERSSLFHLCTITGMQDRHIMRLSAWGKFLIM